MYGAQPCFAGWETSAIEQHPQPIEDSDACNKVLLVCKVLDNGDYEGAGCAQPGLRVTTFPSLRYAHTGLPAAFSGLSVGNVSFSEIQPSRARGNHTLKWLEAHANV